METRQKKVVLAAAAVILAAAAVLVGVIISRGGGTSKLQEQLELGQKYLSEMNYEQAVVAFHQAIEIDPKSADAYFGLADAYAGLGEYEAALDVLRQGYEATGDESFAERIVQMETLSGADGIGSGAVSDGGRESADVTGGSTVSAEEAEAAYEKVYNLICTWGSSFYSSDRGMLLTWEEKQAAYGPLAEAMEEYLRLYPEGEYGYAYDVLSMLYLEMEDLDACLRIRQTAYERMEITGSDPQGTEYTNAYGQSVSNAEYVYEYDDRGRLVHEMHTSTGWEEYLEYDAGGRIIMMKSIYPTDTGTRNMVHTWTYDSNGSVTIRTTYEGTDTRWAEQCTESNGRDYFVTKYDTYGRETVFESYYDGKLDYREETEYAENGERVSRVKTQYNPDGSVSSVENL
ncbi:MAG: tetratricopeptide repeat protein [Lachnospiraceae bacterium]|nr:tetratricopeptide repeat protein [Lachnospiraceae bacterium]